MIQAISSIKLHLFDAGQSEGSRSQFIMNGKAQQALRFRGDPTAGLTMNCRSVVTVFECVGCESKAYRCS